jgi:transposase-like protein
MSEFDVRSKGPAGRPGIPVCPYCNKEVETVGERHLGVTGKSVYFCISCNKVLSITERESFK